MADDAEDYVLGGYTVPSVPFYPDFEFPGAALSQALCCEHVLDLARTDSECERPEGSVRGGMAVPADDRLTRASSDRAQVL